MQEKIQYRPFFSSSLLFRVTRFLIWHVPNVLE